MIGSGCVNEREDEEEKEKGRGRDTPRVLYTAVRAPRSPRGTLAEISVSWHRRPKHSAQPIGAPQSVCNNTRASPSGSSNDGAIRASASALSTSAPAIFPQERGGGCPRNPH